MSGTFHLDDDALTLRYYGELTPLEAHAAEQHLAECAQCAQAAADWTGFLDAIPDPAADLAAPDWTRFEANARKARRAARWSRTLASLPRAAGWFAAVVGLGIAFGMFWGRARNAQQAANVRPSAPPATDHSRSVPPAQGGAEPTQPVANYLENSRELLTDVFQTPVSCSVNQHDLSSEVEMTRSLLASQETVRSHLAPLPSRYGTLVEDVDGALRTLHEMGPCASPAQLASLRHRLQEEQLIARLALSAEELRALEPAAEIPAVTAGEPVAAGNGGGNAP